MRLKVASCVKGPKNIVQAKSLNIYSHFDNIVNKWWQAVGDRMVELIHLYNIKILTLYRASANLNLQVNVIEY